MILVAHADPGGSLNRLHFIDLKIKSHYYFDG